MYFFGFLWKGCLGNGFGILRQFYPHSLIALRPTPVQPGFALCAHSRLVTCTPAKAALARDWSRVVGAFGKTKKVPRSF